MATQAVNVIATNNTTKNCSRLELLKWVNQHLQSHFLKVEEMCSGAAYCLLMDMLFPGTVQLKRIKFNANQEYEYVQNFKLLQAAFVKTQVNTTVPVDKLIKGKYQDNYEFMAFFKLFFDANYNGDPYDPIAARQGAPLGSGDTPHKKKMAPLVKSKPKYDPRCTTAVGHVSYAGAGDEPSTSRKASVNKISFPSEGKGSLKGIETQNLRSLDKESLEEITQNLMTEAEACKVVERESKVYFSKLRAVEILIANLKTPNVPEVVEGVRRIIYAPDDEYLDEASD